MQRYVGGYCVTMTTYPPLPLFLKVGYSNDDNAHTPRSFSSHLEVRRHVVVAFTPAHLETGRAEVIANPCPLKLHSKTGQG